LRGEVVSPFDSRNYSPFFQTIAQQNIAIKYSAEGSTVHFRLGYDTNQVNVEIEDEGIGIPPEGLKHLFEVFYRAKNANNIEGTGLGMPIVKKCLDTHKGRIEVESELNKGTLYRVWIPLG
jgi:signal transduction histidine kinase